MIIYSNTLFHTATANPLQEQIWELGGVASDEKEMDSLGQELHLVLSCLEAKC